MPERKKVKRKKITKKWERDLAVQQVSEGGEYMPLGEIIAEIEGEMDIDRDDDLGPTQVVHSGDLPPLDYEIEGRPLFEQLPDESSVAFEAFQIYRDLGPRRTYEETGRQVEVLRAESLRKRVEDRFRAMKRPVPTTLRVENFVRMDSEGGPRVTGEVRRKVQVWAKQHMWKQRAQAYDRYVDQQKIQSTVEEVQKMVERHISIAGAMQMKAFNRLKEMPKEELTPKLVMEYLLEGAKLERLSREMSTDQVKVSGDRNAPLELNTGVDLREELTRRIEQIAIRKAKTLASFREDNDDVDEGEVRSAVQEMGMRLLSAAEDAREDD